MASSASSGAHEPRRHPEGVDLPHRDATDHEQRHRDHPERHCPPRRPPAVAELHLDRQRADRPDRPGGRRHPDEVLLGVGRQVRVEQGVVARQPQHDAHRVEQHDDPAHPRVLQQQRVDDECRGDSEVDRVGQRVDLLAHLRRGMEHPRHPPSRASRIAAAAISAMAFVGRPSSAYLIAVRPRQMANTVMALGRNRNGPSGRLPWVSSWQLGHHGFAGHGALSHRHQEIERRRAGRCRAGSRSGSARRCRRWRACRRP